MGDFSLNWNEFNLSHINMSNILIKQGYVGIFLFVILNFISMVIYPGGTIIEPETKGYSFFYNFLSNLGESTAKNGEDNICLLYTSPSPRDW